LYRKDGIFCTLDSLNLRFADHDGFSLIMTAAFAAQ
jgi:hypothetical protein